MASDLPDEAVEAAARALWDWLAITNEDAEEWPDADGIDQRSTREGAAMLLAAAAPHLHTDCGCAAACVAKPGIRAQVLTEVDAALRDERAQARADWYAGFQDAADYLRDTLGAGGEGE